MTLETHKYLLLVRMQTAMSDLEANLDAALYDKNHRITAAESNG